MPLLYNYGPPAWTLYNSNPTGANTVRANIIAQESTSWYSDVITKINTAKNTYYPTKTLTITQNNGNVYTGSDLTTSNYDVVFIWTNQLPLQFYIYVSQWVAIGNDLGRGFWIFRGEKKYRIVWRCYGE